MKQLVGLISQALAEVFGESEVSVDDVIEPEDQVCAEAAAGLIMWTCGSYVFIARDDTASGDEEDIAAALWMAAERNSICDIGDTLVLLAGTDDAPNAKTIGMRKDRPGCEQLLWAERLRARVDGLHLPRRRRQERRR